MLVEFDLNTNDLEALLRHARAFQPETDDARENRRLTDALDQLADALEMARGQSNR
ncbi:hypothetical protein [Pseudomonas sp. 5P_5.1_Bac1]|uniref:hypothetical protein n=1 Tax=Pseudomonas sp. 5P_5.1_Bac1 TaxID=2971616 RepID=UPI0021C9E675|nr:hypothetical protein [Pseudomonas sp. 5P_5.1_Bac1]MCU1720524.1 hypothetical protein [Pseudomonas sp. 5P_5.1_Bac1]